MVLKMEDYNIYNWYVFGDSISKGIVYDEVKNKYEITDDNFVNILANRYDAEVQNFSVFGATINKGLNVFSRNQKKLEKNGIAILDFGGNDCDFTWSEVAKTPNIEHLPNTPPAEFKKKYIELINKLKKLSLQPVLLNLPPLDPKRYFDTFSKNLNKENLLAFLGGSVKRIYQWHESYSNDIAEIAIETQSIFINCRDAILQKLHPEDYLCFDGIHPNNEGYSLIADMIYDKTKIYFEKENL